MLNNFPLPGASEVNRAPCLAPANPIKAVKNNLAFQRNEGLVKPYYSILYFYQSVNLPDQCFFLRKTFIKYVTECGIMLIPLGLVPHRCIDLGHLLGNG